MTNTPQDLDVLKRLAAAFAECVTSHSTGKKSEELELKLTPGKEEEERNAIKTFLEAHGGGIASLMSGTLFIIISHPDIFRQALEENGLMPPRPPTRLEILEREYESDQIIATVTALRDLYNKRALGLHTGHTLIQSFFRFIKDNAPIIEGYKKTLKSTHPPLMEEDGSVPPLVRDILNLCADPKGEKFDFDLSKTTTPSDQGMARQM